MKRPSISCLLILIAQCVWAQGVVQQAFQQVGTGNQYVLSIQWTASSVDGSVPVTALTSAGNIIQGYRVFAAEFAPGSPAPSTLYSVAITTATGVDVFAGAAQNISGVKAVSVAAASTAPPVNGTLTLNITGNTIVSAKGSILLYFVPISQVFGVYPPATVTVTTGGIGASVDANALSAAWYLTDVGSTNSISGNTTTTFPSSYSTGQCVIVKMATNNTGATTINIRALGAKSVTKNGANALASGNLVSGQEYEMCYDGTQFQVLNFTPVNGVDVTPSNAAYCADATGSTTTYTCPSPSPAIFSLTGLLVTFVPQTTNTGTSTLNVNSLGAKTLKQADGATNVASGALVGGQAYFFTYNGTNFVQNNSNISASTQLSDTANIVYTNQARTMGAALTIPGGDLFNGGINRQTGASYTIAAADDNKIVTFNNAGAVAVTLPQAGTAGFANGMTFAAFNIGAGAVTITPTTSTFNGAATVVLNQNQGALIESDGTNYGGWVSAAGGGTGSAAATVTESFGATVTFTCPNSTSDTVTGFQATSNAPVVLTGTMAITLSGCRGGERIALLLKQDATGNRAVTINGITVPVHTAANATTTVYVYFDGTNPRIASSASDTGYSDAAETAAPGTPPAGHCWPWYDSTDHRYHDKCNNTTTIGTSVVSSTAPANQFATGLSTAGVISYARPTYANLSTSFPEALTVPAANCNNATGGAGWNIPASNAPTVACRAGTNNLDGVLQWANNNTTTNSQFELELPLDWDGTNPFIRIFYGSGANTSGTVKWTFSTACTKGDGSITDDPAFVAETATAGNTMAVANRMWSESLQFTAVTGGNNCVAGGPMLVKVTSGNGTATSTVNVYKTVVTIPRNPVVQAE